MYESSWIPPTRTSSSPSEKADLAPRAPSCKVTLALPGLAIVGVKEQKAIIFHLSTIEMKDFEPSTRLITEYLTNNSLVKEVLFSFRHFNQTDEKGEMKLNMLEAFKEHLKKIGYKWLRLDNHTDGSRWTCFIFRAGAKDRGDSHERERQTRLKTGQLLTSKLQLKYVVLASHDEIICQKSSKSNRPLSRPLCL
jgi:hypothetical protein